MADIDFTCTSCGNTATISEFVERDTVRCSKCGGIIKGNAAPTIDIPKLKLKESGPLAVAPQAQNGPQTPNSKGWLPESSQNAAAEYKERAGLKHSLGSWSLFLVVGGVLGVARYTDWIQHPALPEFLRMVKQFGPWVILAFHVLIVLKAFKDSVFQGILCVLIPCYSFYYLFLMSDDFYLRAMVGGLLIGLGQDSAVYYNDIIMNVADIVTKWIASGG